MTAGCISEPADITTFIYNILGDRQSGKSELVSYQIEENKYIYLAGVVGGLYEKGKI